jgi:UPF0716 protein FxsA
MALVVAGAFLLTPGFFTDTLGFLLLFPPTRIWLASLVASRMVVSGSMHAHSLHERANQGQPDHGDPLQGRPRRHHDADVIDGVKYRRDDD